MWYKIFELESVNINGIYGYLLKNAELYYYGEEDLYFSTEFKSFEECEKELLRYKEAKGGLNTEYVIQKIYR